MSKTWVAALICGLLGALVVAGCGSDEESLTKDEYVKQANAICKQTLVKRNAAVETAVTKLEKSGKPRTIAFEEELITDVALPPFEEMTEELDELGEPDAKGAQAAAMVAAFEEGIEKVEKRTIRVVKAETDPFHQAKKLAASYGLEECSDF